MWLQTVLNRCYRFKRFVYKTCRFEAKGGILKIIVRIQPRKNSKPQCSGCGSFAPTYDHQPVRIAIWTQQL